MQDLKATEAAWAAKVTSLEQQRSVVLDRNDALEAKALKVRAGVALLYATPHEHVHVCTVARLTIQRRPSGVGCCKQCHMHHLRRVNMLSSCIQSFQGVVCCRRADLCHTYSNHTLHLLLYCSYSVQAAQQSVPKSAICRPIKLRTPPGQHKYSWTKN